MEYNPSEYLRTLLQADKQRQLSFVPPTVDSAWIDEYDFDRIGAIRSNDINALRLLLEQGKSFNACNSNGETLLHLACRRGNLETVNFLIHEAKVRVDVQDDMGRTVLHDTCWRPTPNLEIMKTLIQVVSPYFLLLKDARGHTCFDYCRREHWAKWIGFLEESSSIWERRTDLVDLLDIRTNL